MIRGAVALLLVLLAAPAFAQNADSSPRPLRPSVTPQKAATQTPVAPPPVRPQSPPAAFTPIPRQPNADQCRTSCMQTYYFCLAENEIQDCSPAWGQCRLACANAATPS